MTKEYINNNGITLCATQQGKGEDFVISHGLIGNKDQSLVQFAALTEKFKLTVFDQRGHNQSSPVTDSKKYDIDLMADDILTVMNHFEIENAVLCGESMGAASAIRFTLKHPERVNKLLITAPAFGPEPNTEIHRFVEMSNAIRKMGMASFLVAVKQRWGEEGIMPDGAFEGFSALMSKHDAESISTAMEKTLTWTTKPDIERLNTLKIPVKIVGWRDDPLHPFSLAKLICSKIPDCELKESNSPFDAFTDPANIGKIYLKMLTNEAH